MSSSNSSTTTTCPSPYVSMLRVLQGASWWSFWKLRGSPGVFWGSSWGVLKGSMAPFLEPWGSLGVHLESSGSHLGVLGGPWGPPSFPMVAQGRHRVPFWLLIVRLWLHFRSILGATIVKFSCFFWLHFWMHFWRPLAAFLVSFWLLLGGFFCPTL